jgi:hypothetical protein
MYVLNKSDMLDTVEEVNDQIKFVTNQIVKIKGQEEDTLILPFSSEKHLDND